MSPPEVRRGAVGRGTPKSQVKPVLSKAENSESWLDPQALSSPDENWPDAVDHICQLADAGVLPDLEDYA